MSQKRSRANFEGDQPTGQQPPFVFYGTALPPLDSETRDDGSYVPLWKQEVRDERGRKRLHGAFTGGFSAGYFNTVGSKEGWTPSTFVSSRSNRAKDGASAKQQTNQDFMDEEDLADLQESQKLSTQSGFGGIGSTEQDVKRAGFMTDLFRASGDTMGVKLLQRMGWRRGQGIGPRVRRKARDQDESGADEGQSHLFAPDDSLMIAFQRKTDRAGLGYSKGERLGSTQQSTIGARTKQSNVFRDFDEDEDDETITFAPRKPLRPKIKSNKSGLGVGVLNDTGSDDEDPYSIGPKISYNRIIGGDKKKARMGITASSKKPPTTKSVFLSQKLTKSSSNSTRRCYDGRLPLDGYILSSIPLSQDQENKFPPPVVPPHWQSSFSRSGDSSDPIQSTQSTSDLARASILDPAQRAKVLGEASLPGKSIFDYMSPAARNKLANASNRPDLPQGMAEPAPAGFEASVADRQKDLWSLVPQVERQTAQAALDRGAAGWMPYSEDSDKRERYRTFLESMTGLRKELPIRREGASKDDWIAEMREFAQAAMVFKPVSGLMASRFTTGSAAPRVASDAPDSMTEVKEERKHDPAEDAAKLGMFGHMTRSRISFYPSRLLCKRFGVKPPAHVVTDPGEDPMASSTAAEARAKDARLDVVSRATMDAMLAESRQNFSTAANSATEPSLAATDEGHAPADVSIKDSQLKTGVVDVERNDALEGQRAGEELFKSIFGDSDDE